jgi:hypothetical protein
VPGWIVILLLFYAAVRWPAVRVVFGVILSAVALIGIVAVVKIGVFPVLAEALVEMSVNLIKTIGGLLYFLLFS